MSKRVWPINRNPKPGHLIDLTGRIFGRLLVEYRKGSDKKGEAIWVCTCECGNQKPVIGTSLRSGATTSCGCLQKELIGNRARKHGLSKNPRHCLMTSAEFRARKAGIPFNLTIGDIPEIPVVCPVLGIVMGGSKKRGHCPNSPSLDRIIPKKGYTKGNIRIISHRANQLKSDGTPEELMLVAKDAVNLREAGF